MWYKYIIGAMNLIEQLQKISAKLFQESIKNYKLKDVVAHKFAKPPSLVEYLSLYPNKGQGFHIRRKGWQNSKYIRITASQFKSNRYGTLRGMEYDNGKKQWDAPKKLHGTSKRGIWLYEIGQAIDSELDNGMIYTPKDFQAYLEFRKRVFPEEHQQAEAEAGQVQAEEQPEGQAGEQASPQAGGEQQK